MPRMIYTVREILTDIPGMPNLEELLAGVAWLSSVDMHHHLLIQAVIKPDLSLKTPLELLAQLTAGYVKVVSILEDAGVAFWNMPELTITGKAHGQLDQQRTDQGFHEIEARVRIELYYPR